MAQWFRVLADLSEDPSVVPSIHARQLTTACNSSSRHPWPLWHPQVLRIHVYT